MLKPIFGSFLAISFAFSATSGDSPDLSRQRQILERVRLSAERYLESLPNFVCLRVTEQYEAGKKPKHWARRDTLTEKLVFNQGKENQTLEMVNGKIVSPERFVARPLQTEGEFGGLVSKVLDANSYAQILWTRWEDLRSRRLAVFTYVVDQDHSRLNLAFGGRSANIPYRGLIYADPETGELWRITQTPFDMPDFVETKSVTTTIDYGRVEIGNHDFFLPINAEVLLDTGKRNILNKVSFTSYRKFEAESKITFLSGSN